MTPAYILPQKETRTYRFSVLRVIAMSLMLFLLTAACLYLHNTIQENYVSYLTTAEKKTTVKKTTEKKTTAKKSTKKAKET